MIVEELIGRLSLQTKGIDQARKATKELENFRKALKGLAGASRMNLSGPVNMAKAYTAMRREAERLATVQARMGNSSGLQKQLSTVQRLRTAYMDTAKAAALVGKRPSGSGGSWLQDELRALRQYKREMADITRQAGRFGVPRGHAERGAGLHYGGPANRLHERAAEGAREAREAISDIGAERARQQQAGMTPDESARLRKRSLELSTKYPSIGQSELEELGRSARNAMPSFDMAIQAMESLAQFQVSQQSARGIEAAAGQIGRLMKALDNMGRLDSLDEMNQMLEGINKATNVEGKELAPADLLTMARNAKSAGATLSPEYLTTDAATLMQDMGPAQLGTALGTMLSQMVGGRATKKSKRVLEEAGLADYGLTEMTAEEAQRRDALGIKGKGTVDPKLLMTHPTKWMEKYGIPNMQKAGVETNDNTAVSKFMTEAFSAQKVAEFWTKTVTQMPQLLRNRKMYGNAPDMKTSAQIALTQNPKVSDEAAKQSTLNIARQIADQYNTVKTTAGGAYSTVANQAANLLAEDPATRGTAALGAGAAGAVGLKWLHARGLLKLGRGLVGGTGGGAGASATGAAAGGAATAVDASSKMIEGMSRAGTSAGAQSVAGGILRGLLRLAPAVAAPLTMDASKADRDKMTMRLGAYAQGQLAAKQGAGLEMLPNKGAVEARLSEIKTTTDAQAEKMKEALSFTAKPTVDPSSIQAALSLAEKLKATLDGAKASASAAGSGIGGAGLAKGSNTFTSPGATAP